MTDRIKSVIELAKFKCSDIVYWVNFRPLVEPCTKITKENEWMMSHHPKVIHERGVSKAWPRGRQLPKLHEVDFQAVVMLLTSVLMVQQFKIIDVARSTNTGEFFYLNDEEEFMPESYLFETEAAANKELARIKKLINKWSE